MIGNDEFLTLSKTEQEKVEESLNNGIYDRFIDKRGTEKHRRLIYEAIFYLQKEGYSLIRKTMATMNSDAVFRKGKTQIIVECGQVLSKEGLLGKHKMLLHVSYSRRLTLITKAMGKFTFKCYKSYYHKIYGFIKERIILETDEKYIVHDDHLPLLHIKKEFV